MVLSSWFVLVNHFEPATTNQLQCPKNSLTILSWYNLFFSSRETKNAMVFRNCTDDVSSNSACELTLLFLFLLQNRGSKQSVVCQSPVPVFEDQVEHGSLVSLDALEVMSECDMPIAFTRGSRSRASLPVVRSTNQTKDRSLGIHTGTRILNYIQIHSF